MRASGVLLPVSSLASKYGIGCFSKEAYQFVDFLKKNGQAYWQILPLGQTSYGDSPYQSFSTFAGNPYFISLEKLVQKGLLRKKDCDDCDFGKNPADVDYGRIYRARYRLLRKAFEQFYAMKDSDYAEFLKFQEREAAWLSDYGLFMALKDSFNGKSWVEWPDDIRLREPEALEASREKFREQALFYEYLQYEFFSEWEELKSYANGQGIQIIGDIPIYVALDSADAWAEPELFQFDEDCRPVAVAGCPPDGFSATGQLWGNPLYDWAYHKKTGYAWWVRRVSACYKMYDMIRIDHFRGFDEYYAIPAKDKTAEFGTWEKGPGIGLFEALKKELGSLNVIVEDLGYITDSVRELVRAVGFPNMKVLEFAFDARDSSGPKDYLPYNYDKNCVVYTGTHDNETLLGWLDSIPKADYGMIERYLGRKIADRKEMVTEIIRLAQASAADLCIIPLQDYLCLDNSARINEPSTLGQNWRWRLLPDQLTLQAGLLMKNMAKTYGRIPSAQNQPDKNPGQKTRQDNEYSTAAGSSADTASTAAGSSADTASTAFQSEAAEENRRNIPAGEKEVHMAESSRNAAVEAEPAEARDEKAQEAVKTESAETRNEEVQEAVKAEPAEARNEKIQEAAKQEKRTSTVSENIKTASESAAKTASDIKTASESAAKTVSGIAAKVKEAGKLAAIVREAGEIAVEKMKDMI